MTNLDKTKIYNQLSALLTDYETKESHSVTIDDFYNILVELQRDWDEITSVEVDVAVEILNGVTMYGKVEINKSAEGLIKEDNELDINN